MKRRVAAMVALNLILPFLSACSRTQAARAGAASAPHTFTVTGVVRAPLHDGQVVIEHEAVPGFMPGMTMPFYVANETEAARLEAGDRVRFHFVVGETSHAQDFEIIGHDAPATAAPIDTATHIHRLKQGDVVPAFQLVDQDEHIYTAGDLDGHLTFVTFIFTRCPVPEFCPATTSKFKALQKAIVGDASLRARASLLTVTLDPEFDRPAILKAYGEAVGADFTRWRFVTGDVAAAGNFARAFSVFSERRNGTLDHTLCTALIGPDRRIIDIWRGNGWQVDELLASIRKALPSS